MSFYFSAVVNFLKFIRQYVRLISVVAYYWPSGDLCRCSSEWKLQYKKLFCLKYRNAQDVL